MSACYVSKCHWAFAVLHPLLCIHCFAFTVLHSLFCIHCFPAADDKIITLFLYFFNLFYGIPVFGRTPSVIGHGVYINCTRHAFLYRNNNRDAACCSIPVDFFHYLFQFRSLILSGKPAPFLTQRPLPLLLWILPGPPYSGSPKG